MHPLFSLLSVIPRTILRPMALLVKSPTGVKANFLVLSYLLGTSDRPMTKFAAYKTFVSPPGPGPFSWRASYPGLLLSWGILRINTARKEYINENTQKIYWGNKNVTQILWTGKSLFSGIPGEQESTETEIKAAPKERHLRAGIEPGATYMRRLSLGQTEDR